MTSENLKARRRFAVMAIVIAAIGAALPMGKAAVRLTTKRPQDLQSNRPSSDER